MPLPPHITRKLLQATSDKTSLNHQALRISQSFQEVKKLLGTGQTKNTKK